MSRDVGRTSRGTQVLVNVLADEADVFLVVSDVKVHYFAGYSNPVKNFLPGISAFRTVEQNHSLALLEESTHGLHPWHPDPSSPGRSAGRGSGGGHGPDRPGPPRSTRW